MRQKYWVRSLLFIFVLCSNAVALYGQTNDQIKQAIIDESVQNYSGNCPCPYNTDRAGRRCGKRSAYSRPGGESPVCYPEDVTIEMIEHYKRTQH